MMRETAGEPAREQAQAGGGGGADGARAQPVHEQIGPLSIERLRKDDGRALILYSHAGDRRR